MVRFILAFGMIQSFFPKSNSSQGARIVSEVLVAVRIQISKALADTFGFDPICCISAGT